MKKILLAILIAFSATSARNLTVEVCNRATCYTQVFKDVKKYEILEDFTGRKLLRVTFSYGNILDVSGESFKIR